LATHTYSHFYCGEVGATPSQFCADIACAQEIASDFGVRFSSLVFPRNQILPEFVDVLEKSGIYAYRGNPDHWLYRNGHNPTGGVAGRMVRFVDSWLPLTGLHLSSRKNNNSLVNVQASQFLRPWSNRLAALELVRLARIKYAMTIAARQGKISIFGGTHIILESI